MPSPMLRQSSVALLVALLLLASPAPGGAASRAQAALERAAAPAAIEIAAPAAAELDTASTTDDGRIQVFVELADPPAAALFAAAMKGFAANDAAAKARAGAASRAQVEKIEAAQAPVRAALAAAAIDAREIYHVARVMNGIAVAIARDRVPAVLAIPGVRRVLPIAAEQLTNSTSVPFIGAPQLWGNTIGLPSALTGVGIRIGIIDTGIDYQHSNFGGTGLLADYQANDRTVVSDGPPFYPTAKVVGGTDFAGDAYTGANAPVPDPDPMDCNGHGSHVAGTAAGFGVDATGATFAGPYGPGVPFGSLRIGPGVAPQASLYALRVFGCTGSTALTVAAIDWSVDPNGDNDLSDHLDVINMSLGSAFGSVSNTSAIASDFAASIGEIVVASAGNSGDTFFIGGSPGSGSRVIATAAAVDSGEAFPFVHVNSPAPIAGDYLAGGASFGPLPSGQTGNGVVALDPTTPAATCGALSTDACCALTNAAAIAGNICVVDRGTCTFNVKAQNCQAAGAIGMVVVDNAPGSPPPGLGGTDPTIVIPSVRLSLADGTLIKNTITSTPPVNMTLNGPAGGDTLASFSSRGPRRILDSPRLRLKPDLAAPGLNITSTQTGVTCTAGACQTPNASGFIPGNTALVLSGTSMASPHMAGTLALLRQLHPDWSVEELKALAMNYAIHDVTLLPAGAGPRYGASRIGAGRTDLPDSALGTVVAMNADDVGLVSVTFEPEVVGLATQVKKVRIVNKGTSAQSFTLGIDTVVDAPGVSFSLPGGNTVNVPASDTVEIDVQMSADAAQMDHARDATLFATQGVQANYGDQPRNFLTEESAYLTFSQSATLEFRLPLYMAERPHSAMSAADTIVTGGAGSGSTTIPLSGTGLCTGTIVAGPSCSGSFPNDVESAVSPFELQVVSPRDSVNPPPYADLHYAGVAYLPGSPPSVSNDLVLFGVQTWGSWSTLDEVAVTFCLDTNEDGTYDKSIINTNPSVFVANASANDNFVRVIQDLGTGAFTILGLGSFVNLISPSVFDTALHLNNVFLLGATPAQLAMTAGDTTFRYKVVTCPATNPGCARSAGVTDRCSPAPGTFFDQEAGPFFYNWAAQGLNFGGDFLDEDLNGNSLPVSWNTANMTTNGSRGALLLHHHNGEATSAEVVLLDTDARADLALAKSVAPANPTFGQNVVFTLTVTNNGPSAASSVVVNDPLPAGLTYVSDDGAGAYSTATDNWSVGALAAAASATLHITATVETTEPVCNRAVVAAAAPLDPNPANDQSTVCVSAPRSADLAVSESVNSPTVLVGASVTYTISVTNHGDDPAYALDVNETFPAYPALDPTSFSASVGSYDPATGLWNLASLPPGGSGILSITLAAPNIAGPLTDQAVAAATTSDPDNANNTASATTTVLSPATISATKTVAGTFVEGGAVTYTIVLSNSSTYAQQDNPGAEFTDVLPGALTATSANATSGSAAVAGNTVTWNGVVPGNGTVTITIGATINAGTALTTISNQGATAFDIDGNGVNEAAGVTDDPAVGGATDPTVFTVLSPAALGSTKVVSAGPYLPGGTVTYTIVVTNTGNSPQNDNPGDEFVDVLPAGVALLSASATSGTALATTATNTVTWNGVVPAAGSVTITIQAAIVGSAGDLVSNQGTANFDADGNGTNESQLPTDDPTVGGATDPTVFEIAPIQEIPTLAPAGLAIFLGALALAAVAALRRRRPV